MHRPPHNLFFAAVPPPEVVGQIDRLWSDIGTRPSLRRRTLHLSVLGLGQSRTVDASFVQAVTRAVDPLRLPAFRLTLDRMVSFKGRDRHPVVLTAGRGRTEVEALAQAIFGGLPGWASGPRRPGSMTPHVTLCYSRRRVPPCPLPRPISWPVTEVVLIDSLQGQTRHVPLARWPLQDGVPPPAGPCLLPF